jgi:hypothetical protein
MNPHQLHDSLVKKGHEKARTAAYAATTDRLRKEVRARCVVGFINAGSTLGKAESLALLEPDYIEACERAEQAEEAAGIAAVEYAAAQAYVDVWRSLEASERARMTLR